MVCEVDKLKNNSPVVTFKNKNNQIITIKDYGMRGKP